MMAGRATINKKARVLTAGPITVDLGGHCATIAGNDLNLTRTEFDLLAYLLQNPGRVISRVELLEAVQRSGYTPAERTVDAHIKNLRTKLAGHPAARGYIQTVYGVGYRLRVEH